MTFAMTAENERALVFLIDEGMPKADAHALMPDLVAFADAWSLDIRTLAHESAIIYDGLDGEPDRAASTMRFVREIYTAFADAWEQRWMTVVPKGPAHVFVQFVPRMPAR